jgi:KaiC/GvpD/RAD55 family RecA-like ATPase
MGCEGLVRVSTGVRELDVVLGGGVPKDRWVALSSELGTGESIM